MARAKETVPPQKTSTEELVKHAHDYAEADARVAELNAQLDQELAAIRDKYSVDIKLEEERRDAAFGPLRNYALLNKDKFQDKRSMDLVHGSLGFRLGNKKVEALKGFTQKHSLALLEQSGQEQWVRVKTELNKEAIIADYDKQYATLQKFGLTVTQDETVFFEPTREGQAE